MADKIYINGVFILEHKFQGGGEILKVNIPADKIEMLASQLKQNASDGWVRLVISRNRNPVVSAKSGKPVSTHSLSVDSWKPEPKTDAAKQSTQNVQDDDESSQVPF